MPLSDNYECDGQISLFDLPEEPPKSINPEVAKAPIYHVSLNHVWEECPKCKAYNKATHDVRGADGRFYWVRNERCPECNQLFDWSDDAVEKATKYSKDYLEHRKMKEQKN
jgi:phage FluMu protein Com